MIATEPRVTVTETFELVDVLLTPREANAWSSSLDKFHFKPVVEITHEPPIGMSEIVSSTATDKLAGASGRAKHTRALAMYRVQCVVARECTMPNR